MKNSPLKIGIIGLGVGMRHAKACSTLSDVKLVALSDQNQDRLSAAASELGVSKTYVDGKKLIEEADVDALIIALPNHLHAPFSIHALHCGKHVLVEKPIASTIESAQAMIQASRETGRILMVGYNQRFEPLHVAAHQYIQQSHLGDIYYAKTSWLRRNGIPWWYEAGSKGSLSTDIAGGGPLMDLGIHRLDLALHLMGFPKVQSVDGTTFSSLGILQGRQQAINFALEDAGVAIIRFKDNRALFLEAAWTIHCKESNEIQTILYGSKGGMCLGNQVEVYSNEDHIQTDTLLIPKQSPESGGVTGHFCRVVQGKEQPLITMDQALTGLTIIKAIYQSARTGKPVFF